MKPLAFLLLFLLLAACHKKDSDNSNPPPIDSTAKSPYPDTAYYAGSLHATNTLDETCPPPTGFDTTYSTTLAVYYPDSFHVKFQLDFWDCKESSYPSCIFPRYIFRQEDLFVKNSSGFYQDTPAHHYYTEYIQRGDSLIIRRAKGSAGLFFHRYLTFDGKKL